LCGGLAHILLTESYRGGAGVGGRPLRLHGDDLGFLLAISSSASCRPSSSSRRRHHPPPPTVRDLARATARLQRVRAAEGPPTGGVIRPQGLTGARIGVAPGPAIKLVGRRDDLGALWARALNQIAERRVHAIPIRLAIAFALSCIATQHSARCYLAAHHADRPLCGGRQRRRGGAHRLPKVSERLCQSVVIENVARRRRDRRHATGGTRRARRLHAAVSVESTMAIAKLVHPSTGQYDSRRISAHFADRTSPARARGQKDLAANTTDELISSHAPIPASSATPPPGPAPP